MNKNIKLRSTVQVISKQMDPIEENEPNTIVVNVTKDMSKEDVLAEIRRRIEEFKTQDKPAGGFPDGFYKAKNAMFEILKVEPTESHLEILINFSKLLRSRMEK